MNITEYIAIAVIVLVLAYTLILRILSLRMMKPLYKDVTLIRSIADLEIALGFALISIASLIYSFYFNTSKYFILIIIFMLLMTSILGLKSFIKLKKALQRPLELLKKIETKEEDKQT